jgi:acetyl esterase
MTSLAYAHVCEPFVAVGIACATMDYRLAPKHSWPAMPDEVAAAVVKVRQVVAARGGGPRVFLFGHSSACQLAAVVGTYPA